MERPGVQLLWKNRPDNTLDLFIYIVQTVYIGGVSIINNYTNGYVSLQLLMSSVRSYLLQLYHPIYVSVSLLPSRRTWFTFLDGKSKVLRWTYLRGRQSSGLRQRCPNTFSTNTRIKPGDFLTGNRGPHWKYGFCSRSISTSPHTSHRPDRTLRRR